MNTESEKNTPLSHSPGDYPQSRAAKWLRARRELEERMHQERVAFLARQQAEAKRGKLARVKALLGRLFRGRHGHDEFQ